MEDNQIVAIGLLTREDVQHLGAAFTRLWPVEESANFDSLLQAIDAAEKACVISTAGRPVQGKP